MNITRKLLAALLALAAPVHAATNATVTQGDWALYRSSTIVSRHATEAACVAAAKALNVARSYTCRTSTGVAITITPDVCTTPQPAAETQTVQCPAGTTGSWQQSRSYVSAPFPTCWTAGAWSPATAPAGACVTPPPPPTSGTTYYVRPDGGTAAQCTGRADAAYPGSGTAQACAWAHPFWALPPKDSADPVRIAGGDTLEIAPAEYRMGYGAPNTSACESSYPWDCYMKSPPSGPSATAPTRIVGKGWNGACVAKPVLWGAERVASVVNIAGAKNVMVACVEITDRAACAQWHDRAVTTPRGYTCKRDVYPFGDWAQNGMAISGVENLTLQDLDIHGLSDYGILAGNVTNQTLTRVRLAANGWGGFNGDLGASPGSAQNYFPGRNAWSRVTVEWNGCVETYPAKQPMGCWGQSAGGYGDGVGTGRTGGDWVITDSVFRFNTSDGLDLLYHAAGGTLTIERVWAEGNAGNQIKVAGNARIANAVVLGNCDFHAGKPFEGLVDIRAEDGGDADTLADDRSVDSCRALVDSIAVTLAAGESASIVNSTIVSGGNTIVTAEGSGALTMRNNLLAGILFSLNGSRTSGDVYTMGPTVDEQHDTKLNLYNPVFCNGTGVLCQSGVTSFGIASADRNGIDPRLPVGSTLRNAGVSGALIPSSDYYGNPRPALGGVDRGAVEAQD